MHLQVVSPHSACQCEHTTWTKKRPPLGHWQAEICDMKEMHQRSLESKVRAELGLGIPEVLSHHGTPSQRPRTCHTVPGELSQRRDIKPAAHYSQEALRILRSRFKASLGPTTSELRGLHPSIHATLLAHVA